MGKPKINILSLYQHDGEIGIMMGDANPGDVCLIIPCQEVLRFIRALVFCEESPHDEATAIGWFGKVQEEV